RDLPVHQGPGGHGGPVTYPGRVGGLTNPEVGEVGRAGEHVERQLSLLYSAFQIRHHERRRNRVFDVQLGLRPRHFEPEVETLVAGNVDSAGEPRTIVELPVGTGIEHWRVLHRVRVS